MSFSKYLLLPILIIFSSFSAAEATQIIPLSLSKIVKGAQTAFVGTCLEKQVEVKRDGMFPSGYLVTTYTFRIDEWLKKQESRAEKVGDLYTFRQWGASRAESIERGLPFIVGQPQHDVGKQYVLFLVPPSEATGLTSPVGLSQGVMEVVVAPNGSKMIKSSSLNPAMLTGFSSSSATAKALAAKQDLPLEALMQAVQSLHKESQK